MTFSEFETVDKSNITLIDVREKEEYMLGTIKGSLNFPLDELNGSYLDIPKDKPVYVFCSKGVSSKQAFSILKEKGYEVYNLDGGYEAYLRYLMTQEEKH